MQTLAEILTPLLSSSLSSPSSILKFGSFRIICRCQSNVRTLSSPSLLDHQFRPTLRRSLLMELPDSAEEARASPSEEDVCHRCSFCNKGFHTLQALGGHQTLHRQEIKEMRRRNEACRRLRRRRGNCGVISGHRPLAAAGSAGVAPEDDCLRMVPLGPNRAFWEAHRRLSCEPKIHDFFAASDHGANVLDGISIQVVPESLCFDPSVDLDLKL